MDLSNLTSVLFNDEVNDTQVCYHLVYPKHFNLIKKSKITQRTGCGQSVLNNKRRRRGRPRKEDVKKSEEDRRIAEENANDEKPDENVVIQFKSTRYGRVSRPPKHMSKFVDIKDTRITSVTTDTTSPMDTTEIQNNIHVDQQPEAGGKTMTEFVVEPKKVRKNVDRFTCAVCKKVYLGRKKMLKHYLTFPEHKIPPIQNNQSNGLIVNSFLFDELMKAVGSASQTERISMFLTEISNFVSKIRLFKPKILHTEKDSSHPSTEYYVDKNVSKILDLPEGLLQLNDRFADNYQQNNNKFSTYIEETNGPSDQISSLSNLQQQLGYNLNLFPQVNYDQISDNAVEAEALGKSNENDTITDLPHETPILDIPLDLFSFNNIK